ncbi:SWR1-complex protein 4-like, partial [Hibiscus syriacus]|uniref:SWR1-complex protein 4-like n=1 Tax=Hibiscus syriacus TaxID=106335 RepID=UPI00192198AC
YNVTQEIERKRALSMVLSQTKHQERKDAEVLAEAKRIAKSRMAARVAEEPDLPVTSDIVPESAERAIGPGDTISPSNVQVPAAPSTSVIADNSSTLASLHMVCAACGLPFSHLFLSPSKNKNKIQNEK